MASPPTSPDTDALSQPDEGGTPGTPFGSGSTGTGTTTSGAMGSGQAGVGAGQSGDDIDESGADLAYAEMTGVGVSSEGVVFAPGIAGPPNPNDAPGAPDVPQGLQ